MDETAFPESTLNYAGFSPRFFSRLLDSLIALPLSLLVVFSTSYGAFAVGLLAIFVFGLFTEVYMVRRWGGSPGKLVSGIRIVKVDGEPVGYREAILRALPNLLFGVCSSIALLKAFSVACGPGYTNLPFIQRMAGLEAVAPGWSDPMTFAQNIWTWSELIVLLTNEKKRALHDFLAGTVVVIVQQSPERGTNLEASTRA